MHSQHSAAVARSRLVPVVTGRLEEAGGWLNESADNHTDRTNVKFLQFFNLPLRYLAETDNIDSEVIFNEWNDELTDEENLAAVGTKICVMFGDEVAVYFQRGR
jgi:hypothetical protein